jgi:hypothetical protein
VDDIVEGPAIEVSDRAQRSVGRITQGEHVRAVAVVRYQQDPPARLLVPDR